MNLNTIIPEYLLLDGDLLRVYAYLIRIVSPSPSKILIGNEVISLRGYELFEPLHRISQRTCLSEEAVRNNLSRLGELGLLTLTTEATGLRMRFNHLALPSSPGGERADVKDVNDCWLEDFASEYLESVRASNAPKTYENAKRVMKHFVAFAGRVRLSQLNAQMLEDYKQSRKKQVSKVMDSTINMDLRTLKAAMEVAVTWGKIPNNVFRGVKLIRIPKAQIRALTREEFLLIAESIRESWLLDLVQFAVLTGLRRGEIVNLQWKDVNIENRTVVIESSSSYRVKHGQTRRVQLSPDATDIVRSRSRANQWVFTDEKGQRLRDEYPSKLFKSYVGRCERPEEVHFHTLRATFASWAEQAGVSIYKVKELLGHSTVKVTERYVSHDEDELRTAVERIALPVREKEVGTLTLITARKILDDARTDDSPTKVTT